MNIVFDLGGVVLAWNPDKIINGVFSDPLIYTVVRSEIFQHQDWLDLDRGTLEMPDAIQRFASRTGLEIEDIQRLMAYVPNSLTLIKGTIDLMYRLKNKGHKLFCLSNISRDSYTYIKARYTFWEVFDGIVISSYIKCIKPDPSIFEYLIEKYALMPNDTIFIDDTYVNLLTAEQLGIKTIQFKNAEDCEQTLSNMIASYQD